MDISLLLLHEILLPGIIFPLREARRPSLLRDLFFPSSADWLILLVRVFRFPSALASCISLYLCSARWSPPLFLLAVPRAFFLTMRLFSLALLRSPRSKLQTILETAPTGACFGRATSPGVTRCLQGCLVCREQISIL